jgi:DNA-binding transcriptional regulator YiaG
MSPEEIIEARRKLGLTLAEMATMLGYEGKEGLRPALAHRLETGARRVREPHRRLLEAYLAGYRPKDWPK